MWFLLYSMGQRIIETQNGTKIFGEKLIAVNNLKLEVEKGAIFGFLGPKGPARPQQSGYCSG